MVIGIMIERNYKDQEKGKDKNGQDEKIFKGFQN